MKKNAPPVIIQVKAKERKSAEILLFELQFLKIGGSAIINQRKKKAKKYVFISGYRKNNITGRKVVTVNLKQIISLLIHRYFTATAMVRNCKNG